MAKPGQAPNSSVGSCNRIPLEFVNDCRYSTLTLIYCRVRSFALQSCTIRCGWLFNAVALCWRSSHARQPDGRKLLDASQGPHIFGAWRQSGTQGR